MNQNTNAKSNSYITNSYKRIINIEEEKQKKYNTRPLDKPIQNSSNSDAYLITSLPKRNANVNVNVKQSKGNIDIYNDGSTWTHVFKADLKRRISSIINKKNSINMNR